jgi:hypothetical protein
MRLYWLNVSMTYVYFAVFFAAIFLNSANSNFHAESIVPEKPVNNR